MCLLILKKLSPLFLSSRECYLCLYKRDENHQIEYCDSYHVIGIHVRIKFVGKIKQNTKIEQRAWNISKYNKNFWKVCIFLFSFSFSFSPLMGWVRFVEAAQSFLSCLSFKRADYIRRSYSVLFLLQEDWLRL